MGGVEVLLMVSFGFVIVKQGARHPSSGMIIVHACTMIIVHACIMSYAAHFPRRWHGGSEGRSPPAKQGGLGGRRSPNDGLH